jgi:hypothetical protein
MMVQSVFRAVTLATLMTAAHAQAGSISLKIEVGSATGNPGATVSIPVTFRSQPVQVGSTQNDIVTALDPIGSPLRIAANEDGTPKCTVNPSFEDVVSSFEYLPGGPLIGIHAQLSFDDARILGNSTLLYTCDVMIADDAPLGSQGLPISNISVTGPNGEALPVTGTDGTVTIVSAPTPVPTQTPIPNSDSDDDGCAVVAPAAQASTGWRLLLPAAALLWVRRRTRAGERRDRH